MNKSCATSTSAAGTTSRCRQRGRMMQKEQRGRRGQEIFARKENESKSRCRSETRRRTSGGGGGKHEAIVSGTRAVAEERAAPVVPEELHAVPVSIADVNSKNLLGYASDLGPDHPGFHDEEYKRRRTEIVEIALDHQLGDPIPYVAYTENERRTWATVLDELSALFPKYACEEFNASLARFNFSRDEVPQLSAMNQVLNEATGFSIRPVGGLLHPRDFLNGLAFRYFHSTQYLRHHGQPMYTPEPDIVHELIGHVPMLADPDYANLVQTIGRASLGASEKMIWHLTKVYWYTVEFGVVRENGRIKGFGAGVLSSFGELEWACEESLEKRPEFLPFDPYRKQPKMSYKDGFQKQYFVLESFQDGTEKLREFAEDMKNGWEL